METKDITSEYYAQATPGVGFITVDDDYHIGDHQAEVRAALFLHNTFGGDIRLLKEIDKKDIKTPDYEWRGKFWELKTAATEKSADGAVRRGMKQIQSKPGGIILDYGDKDVSMAALQGVLKNRFKFSASAGLDIIVVSKGQASVLGYKK